MMFKHEFKSDIYINTENTSPTAKVQPLYAMKFPPDLKQYKELQGILYFKSVFTA